MSNISFFIPAYNCAATITETVESIMVGNLTAGDELVIVNDCSTDNTSEILLSLKNKYPIIQIFTHKWNKGGGAARNTAIENTNHELLFCLDADNILPPNSAEQLRTVLYQQHADIACFNELRYFSTDTSLIDETWVYEPGIFTIIDLLAGKLSPGGNGNYLFTRNSWTKAGGYTEDLGALDTWAFGFKQLIENCKMVIVPNSYYFHRRGHTSYYIRDAWSKRRSVSLRLIKIVINYIDLINPDDVNYIFSKKGRYTWFDDLDKHPIRLVTKPISEPVWEEHGVDEGLKESVKNKVRHYKARIVQVGNKYLK